MLKHKLFSVNKKESSLNTDSLYLDKLEFSQDLRNTWLNFFVENFRVVILLIILLSGWGIFSFTQLPRESNPEVKIAMAVVTTYYPGTSPTDMEELVTKKIESIISGVSGIKKISSTSANSFSSIVVEFDASEEIEGSIRKLRDKLPEMKNEIPEESNDPEVSEISFDDAPIVTFALVGPYDGLHLRDYAEKIQDELEKIPDIREVKISGGDEREIEIAYDLEKLTLYNISLDAANQAINSSNIAVPSGNFEGQEYNYSVRTDGRFYDALTISNIPIRRSSNGSLVYLKDIAQVQEKSIEKTIHSRFSINGTPPQNAITLSIIKRTGGSIIKTVDTAQSKIEEMLKGFPDGITYATSVNQAEQIRKDFNQLSHDFLFTLILVVTLLFLIVGLKEAFVAGLAIPLVFFSTFGVMHATGTSLNFLSIFSLLLSLGLLVDDAIVVVSATKQYMRTGKFTPEEAVLLVLHDFKIVLLSTTLATAWAFLPLLMASGMIGQFIKSIPITVSVTLISSLLIALMINHPLAAVLERIRLTKKFFWIIFSLIFSGGILSITFGSGFGYFFASLALSIILWMLLWFYRGGQRIMENNYELSRKEWDNDSLIRQKLRSQGDHSQAPFATRLIHGIIHFDKILPIYEKYLRLITMTRKRRILTLLGTFLLFVFSISLPILGIVKSEFFPPSDSEEIYITLRGPVGMTLEETDKIASQVEKKLLEEENIINFSTIIGSPGSSDGGLVVGGRDSSNTASLVIKLTSTESRSIKAYEIADKIRDSLSPIQGAKITVTALSGGPPSGNAFQAQIAGEDLQKLDEIAKDLRLILDAIPGVINSDISLREAPAEYTFSLDPILMEIYGVDSSRVGSFLRTAISGSTVTTIIRNNKNIDVVARLDDKNIATLSDIQNLQILNNKNQPVFIKDFSEIKLIPSVESISRIDQKRTVLLTSGVSGETNATQVVKNFQERLAEEYSLPEEYSITYGGENEENQESVMSIIRAMAIAALLIISTLVIQFNSFKKTFIVLVTLPLALIGVFLGMAILNVTLSFPGLIGILALFGIVVKNAIILIDKINLNIRTGIVFEEAILDAGKSRLEAIFITSIVTIAGIIPVTLSNETWTALGSVVIFGLSISSFFTLFIVPTLYMTIIKKKEEF